MSAKILIRGFALFYAVGMSPAGCKKSADQKEANGLRAAARKADAKARSKGKQGVGKSRADSAAREAKDSAAKPPDEAAGPLNPAPKRAPKVEGTLDPQAALKVLSRHHPSVRACYDRLRRVNPAISGELTLVLKIMPDGRVNSAYTEGSTFKDASVGDCVVDKARAWKFEASPGEGPSTFRNRYTFHPPTARKP